MLSNEKNNVKSPTKDKSKKSKKAPPIKKYLLAITSLLSPISPKASASLQDLLSFEASIDTYFTSITPILQKPMDERTPMDIQLIAGYFTYLKEFHQIIKKPYCETTKEILKKIAGVMNYLYVPNNRLLFRVGDEGKRFFIVLNGCVDVVIPKPKVEKMTIVEYFRYLAFLVGYNEIELLNKVINDNSTTYPVEIDDQGGFGKINQWSSQEQKEPKKITLKKLFEYLTYEEKEEICKYKHVEIDLEKGDVISKNNWYNYYERKTKSNVSNKIEEFPITAKEYIARIKKYKDHISEFKPIIINDDNETEISLTIYEYIMVTKLPTGQKFGDIAVNDPLSRRTASIVTSSDCHLGFFTKSAYLSLLKEANERSRKGYMIFILSTYVFKGYSIKLLQNRYFHSFVITKCAKSCVVLTPGDNTKIFLIKEGTFEMGINISMKELTNVILFYFEKIKNVQKEKDEELINIYYDIQKMNKENEKIMYNLRQIKELSKFFCGKSYLKISSLDAPDLFGFTDMSYENGENIFGIKCTSHLGEYLTLDRTIYNMLRSTDTNVRNLESKFTYLKNKKLVKRLLDIRKIKMKTFLEHHSVNKVLELEGYENITGRQDSLTKELSHKKDRMAFPLLKQFLQSASPNRSKIPKQISCHKSAHHSKNNTFDNSLNNISPFSKNKSTMADSIAVSPISKSSKDIPQSANYKRKTNGLNVSKGFCFDSPRTKKSQSTLNLLLVSDEKQRTMKRCCSSIGPKRPRVCIGDYEQQKKENYLNNRKFYLMRSTRGIFLRFKPRIDFKAKLRVKMK